MKGIKVDKRQGERTRRRLMEEGLLNTEYRIFTDQKYIYFPVAGDISWQETKDFHFEKINRKSTFNDRIKEILPKDLQDLMRTFDTIGDIAIMEIVKELRPYEKEIAQIFLETHKHFKTVLSKDSALEGDYRTRKYVYLAGEDTTITTHKEYGLLFNMDLSKVFFSPRLANERKRICGLVEDNETVIDMFCGVGPFSIFISKYSNPKIIYAIDINMEAIRFLNKNVEINKVGSIEAICGDANEEIKRLPSSDRIIMNLPKLSNKFLSSAIKNVKKNGMIHYYTIIENDEVIDTISIIDENAKSAGRQAVILNTIKVKPYSPYNYLTVFDIKII